MGSEGSQFFLKRFSFFTQPKTSSFFRTPRPRITQLFWGSLCLSGKLPTYPSPKPTFSPKREVSVNVGLGKGQVGSLTSSTVSDGSIKYTTFLVHVLPTFAHIHLVDCFFFFFFFNQPLTYARSCDVNIPSVLDRYRIFYKTLNLRQPPVK